MTQSAGQGSTRGRRVAGRRDLVAVDGDERLAVFLRGLVAGAFVGGAIAGSAAWRRIRAGRRGAAPIKGPDSGS